MPIEYAAARAWLETLGPPHDVTVIPGNHDAYVPAALGGPEKAWGDYMRGDDGAAAGTFPFVRRRDGVALIALSSGLPTGPFMATGLVGDAQLSRFAEALDATSGLFRVVLIHHPPQSPPSRHLRRLIDGAEFRQVLAVHGADLVLHGHDHCRAITWLDGPDKKIPAVGAPSASARTAHRHENAAGYNLFQIAMAGQCLALRNGGARARPTAASARSSGTSCCEARSSRRAAARLSKRKRTGFPDCEDAIRTTSQAWPAASSAAINSAIAPSTKPSTKAPHPRRRRRRTVRTASGRAMRVMKSGSSSSARSRSTRRRAT